MLREKEARNQQIINGHDDLVNERRQLVQRIEALELEQQ